jgi:acyl carrier protein
MSDQHTAYRDAILAFARDHLAQDPSQVTTGEQPLISSGLIDSFSLVELALFIEEELGVSVPDPEMTVANFDTAELGAATVMRCAG